MVSGPPADQVTSQRVALVTGGGTGIGRAIATSLAGAGLAVAICGRRPKPLEEVAAAIEGSGGRAQVVIADVTDAGDRSRLVQTVAGGLGPVDVLISSAAGVPSEDSWLDWTEADWRAEVEVMALGGFALAQLAAPGMCARGWGRIIFVTSVLAHLGVDPRWYVSATHPQGMSAVPYHAGKGALIGTMRALACVLGPYGVTVNALSPGMIATEGVEEFTAQEVRRRLEERTPLDRLGTPEEVAAGALFLVSAAASFVNGHELVIDGGWSAW